MGETARVGIPERVRAALRRKGILTGETWYVGPLEPKPTAQHAPRNVRRSRAQIQAPGDTE